MGFKIVLRRSADRGNANHGWLKTYHTFSFANYQHPSFNQYGPLRVINEDRVEPSEGFGLHRHENFEIWSYIVAGELEHKDSLGNLEIMKRGDVQMTSTGSGISHSEYNRNSSKQVHFLQIWGLPSTRNLPPNYYNRHFTDEQKRAGWVKIVAPVGSSDVQDVREATGPAPIHSAISMFATLLSPKSNLSHIPSPLTTKIYIHNIMKSGYRLPSQTASDKFEDGGARIRLNGGAVLEEGDGAFVEVTKGGEGELGFENVGEKEAEVLMFEME